MFLFCYIRGRWGDEVNIEFVLCREQSHFAFSYCKIFLVCFLLEKYKVKGSGRKIKKVNGL